MRIRMDTNVSIAFFYDIWKLIPDRIKSLVIYTHKEKINKIEWNKLTNKKQKKERKQFEPIVRNSSDLVTVHCIRNGH